MGFLSSVMIVRLLGVEEYGRFAFAFTIVSTLAIPCMLGLPTLILREVAGCEATKDWGRMRGILAWSRRIVGLSSLVLCLAAAALIQAAVIPVDPDLRPVLLLALILVPLLPFVEIAGAALRGLHRVFWGQFPNAVIRPVLMMLGVAAIHGIAQRPVTAFEAVALTIFVLMSVLALGLILITMYIPVEVARSTPSYASMEWAKALIPLSMISGLQTLYNNTDLLLIGLLVDTANVGTYRIALSISNIATFGIMAVNLVVMPYYANLHKKGDWTKIWKISRYAGVATFAISATMTTLLFVFGQPAISYVYGQEQSGAYWPAVILSLGSSIYGIWASLGGVAMMTGREDQFLKVLAGSVLSNVILNLLLIPMYQANGAAVASAISFALNGVLLWVLAKNLEERSKPEKP